MTRPTWRTLLAAWFTFVALLSGAFVLALIYNRDPRWWR